MTVGGHTFEDIEVANTPEERTTGLMNRTELGANAGMLFRWDEAAEIRSFHMQNTLIPLDLIGIADGRVVSIDEMQPCEITPCISTRTAPATDALEINAGRSAELGIEAGDRVEISGVPCY